MNKKLSNVISAFTLIAVSMFTSSESIMCYANAASTNEVSYRTNCINLYGDLNSDKYIDTFDLIEMRKLVIENEYSVLADLNYDEIVDTDDLTMLSDYVLGKNMLFDAYFYDDADEDSVCDLFEVAWLKTNPDSDDTDGDTISDYDEIVYSNTSPTNKYTRELSVTDADDDYDDDKLTNSEEIAAGTDATSSDSDSDDISDYDEIKVHNTDPNDDDTDNDNISDGDELKLGLNPDNNKSDGEIPDNEKTFEQTISSDNTFFSNINTDESPYTVSIEINSAGIAEKSIAVHTGEFANASEDNRIKGQSVSFSYNENLKTESAKVYFTPKEAEKIENYMIFEYFPDTNYLLPVESKYTEDSVYTETSKLGTYCLVDISDENASSKKSVEIQSNEIIYNYKLDETEVAFLVDISGSLDETALEETKKSIRDFSQALFEHSENSYVTIIGYYHNPVSREEELIQYVDSENMAILKSIDSVENAISKIAPCTTVTNNDLNTPVTRINIFRKDGLFSSDCKNKYAFILADSTYTFSNRLGYKFIIPDSTVDNLGYIKDDNIHINYIVSKENYNNIDAVNNLKNVCDPLGFGVYSKSETGNFSVDSFARIYSDAIIDLKTVPIAYTSTLNANSIPANVERNAFINSLSKSYDKTKVPEADADGNIDFKDAAVKVGAAQLDANGNLVFPSYYDACDVSESTRLGFEQYMMNQTVSDRLISGAIQIVPLSDKILYEDNDGDTIPDKDDPYPDEAFDDRFMIVNDINFVPTIDFVEKHIKVGQECAYTVFPTPAELAKKAFLGGLCTVGVSTPGLAIWLQATGKDLVDEYEHIISVKFSEFLSWYLYNKGETLYLTSNEVYSAIWSSQQNKEHYSYNINQLRKVVEDTLTSKNKYSNPIHIVTKPSSVFKGCCYKANYCNKAGHTVRYDDTTALDWGYALGEALCAMTAEASVNDGKYFMKIKYYIIDNYEFAVHWEEEEGNVVCFDQIGHDVHEAGLADEFKVIGVCEEIFKWEKGEILYPEYYKEIVIDEEKYNADPFR